MIERAQVIGAGRVGSAMAARLRERGLDLGGRAGARPLCVPDRAIAEVAARVEPGPWVAHVSGATPLAALEPARAPLRPPPLQTFTRARGAEQLDGAFAAVTAETRRRPRSAVARPHARARAVPARGRRRAAYHAGAAIASNYLVTLRSARRARCSRPPARRRRRSTR